MPFWNDRKSMFNFKGKDYGFGEELPAGVCEATLKSLKKKGRTSEKAPVVKVSGRPEPNDRKLEEAKKSLEELGKVNADLLSQIAAAEKGADALNAEISDLSSENDELTQKLGASEKTVTELTEQLTNPKGGKK